MQYKLIIAGVAGTFLEIYDISVYGFFAPLIASNFFPFLPPNSALLSTFGVFFISFAVRPLGAILFGHIGDTQGRKKALVLTIILMSCATCGIGLLPNAHQIGILAPLLLVMMRIIQGLSFSAEYIGSLIFLLEQAPSKRRGFISSLATAGGNMGLLGASFICWLTTYTMSADQLNAWGWRLPFLFAFLGGIVGCYLRLYIAENTQAFAHTSNVKKLPLAQIVRSHKKNMLLITGAIGFYVVTNYLFLVYIPTYLVSMLGFTMKSALAINSGAIALLIILIPLFAALSDKIGRRPLLLAGIIGVAVIIYPYFLLLQQGTLFAILLAETLIIVPCASFFSVLTVACAEQITGNVRFTGMAIGYNLAAAIFGGTTPLIAAWLLQELQSNLLISSYVMLFGVLSMITFLNFNRSDAHSTEHKPSDLSQVW